MRRPRSSALSSPSLRVAEVALAFLIAAATPGVASAQDTESGTPRLVDGRGMSESGGAVGALFLPVLGAQPALVGDTHVASWEYHHRWLGVPVSQDDWLPSNAFGLGTWLLWSPEVGLIGGYVFAEQVIRPSNAIELAISARAGLFGAFLNEPFAVEGEQNRSSWGVAGGGRASLRVFVEEDLLAPFFFFSLAGGGGAELVTPRYAPAFHFGYLYGGVGLGGRWQ